MKQVSFERIDLDQEFVSYGRTVTEADIILFTGIAGIKLPIFLDAQYCKSHSPFGQRIVPGLLIQAFAAGMMEELIGPHTIAALGFGESRFTRPALIGDTLRTHSRVVSKRLTSSPGKGIIEISLRVRNQRDETVMEGTYRLMMKTSSKSDGNA